MLGVDAPGAGNAEHHDMAVTRGYYDSLPERVQQHLVCPIVDELTPITQKHDIEGLMMGEAYGLYAFGTFVRRRTRTSVPKAYGSGARVLGRRR